MGDSGEFVFKADDHGGIDYVGDFEGLYQAMDDPWGQSGEHPRMKAYYQFSRQRLVYSLLELDDPGIGWMRALEVGCGAGHVVNLLQRRFTGRVVHGCDVSYTAIAKASELHPRGVFYHLDIADPAMESLLGAAFAPNRPYDVVILSQILWYILRDLPTVFYNCAKLLAPDGHLIIQTAFIDDQKYGRDIVDGWHGLIRWVLNGLPAWKIMGASYDAGDRFAPHHDGILVLRKD